VLTDAENNGMQVRVKMVGKILGNTGSVFHIFQSFSYYSVNTVIGTKTGYGVAGIGRNMVGLPYRLFSDWAGKFGNFPDFPYCSSGLFRTVHLGWVCYLFSFNPKSFQIFK
jgi:hypothetical protein